MRVLVLVPLAVLAGCPDGTVTVPNRKDAGVPVTACQESCAQDSDCLAAYHCDARRCVPDLVPPTCGTHLECMAAAAGWSAGCQDDRGCPANFACVGDAAGGYCARKPTSGTPCTQTSQEELTLAERDGSGTVVVCGVPRARCHDGTCITGCISDGDCGGETPRCDTQTGVCGCTASSCHTNASTCVSGVCRCARDLDCRQNADHCFDGFCGCTAVSACTLTRAHPGTSWVCEDR